MYRIARNIGIELECSGESRYTRYSTTDYWQRGYDGSVYGHGIEFRFSRPYCGQNVIDAVNEITLLMNENKLKVHGVNAGFHLHLDYRMVEADKAYNLIRNADSIYDFISTKVGKSRLANSYCYRPDGQSGYYNGRYRWIHTGNMYNEGKKTVEVRLHNGTRSASKILTWCEFWSEFSLQSDAGNISQIRGVREYNNMVRSLNISSNTRNRFLC
jgi:hypothetical protein